MRQYFLPIVAIASSVMISCQQSQPSTPSTTQIQQTTPTPPVVAAKPVPNTATKIKYVYPPEAISNYVDVCTKGGGTKKSCNCFISKAQDIYPLDKLIQINNDSSVGKPYPKNIDDILNSCKEKVAVVPEVKPSAQAVKPAAPVVIPVQKSSAPEVIEVSGRAFLEKYLNGITKEGNDGRIYFCASAENYVVSFFSPRKATILGSGYESGDRASYKVRIDSSNKGGSQITTTWDFIIAKEENLNEKMMKDRLGSNISDIDRAVLQSLRTQRGGWCILTISKA